MQHHNAHAAPAHDATPRLSRLGKQIEKLRIERGLSKQALAAAIGTSRQQLWRVITGKSELTDAVRARLAHALGVRAADLTDAAAALGGVPVVGSPLPRASDRRRGTARGYFASAAAIAETLRSMPSGASGFQLKRRFLDAVEETALAHGHHLDDGVFELRRRVHNREL